MSRLNHFTVAALLSKKKLSLIEKTSPEVRIMYVERRLLPAFRIHISESTKNKLDIIGGYSIVCRGEVELKVGQTY